MIRVASPAWKLNHVFKSCFACIQVILEVIQANSVISPSVLHNQTLQHQKDVLLSLPLTRIDLKFNLTKL